MRLGLLAEMSPRVREKIFSGAFPVYPYMYTLRQFMRMNGVHKQEVEEFVLALSGKKLSVREIEQLAHGYFRGPASFRQAIREGHPGLVLETMRQVPEDPDGCNEFERVLLKDLEITQKYMLRVMGKSEDRRLKTPAFHAQVNLLTAGILSQQQAFFDSVRKLQDRKSTRLNSSHSQISYAVFCLKKKKQRYMLPIRRHQFQIPTLLRNYRTIVQLVSWSPT